MTGYTGWNQPLMVTLTATSNPYLKDRLPARGLLRVHEMRTDGYAQASRMTFIRVDDNDQPIGSEVYVDDAEFRYDGVKRVETEISRVSYRNGQRVETEISRVSYGR